MIRAVSRQITRHRSAPPEQALSPSFPLNPELVPDLAAGSGEIGARRFLRAARNQL